MLQIPMLAPNVEALGRVNESLYSGVFSDVRSASAVYLYRFEKTTGGSYNVPEYTVGAGGVISGGGESGVCSLFGTVAADVSSDDAPLIACDSPIKSMWFDVTRAAVYTAGTLEVHDNADFARSRTIASDGTNGFKNAGVREIVLADAASTTASWQPGGAMMNITSRPWYRLKLSGLSGMTVSPQISRAWLTHADGGITYLDLTANANGSLTVAPSGVDFLPTNDSSAYYATENKSYGEERYVFLAQGNNRTRVMEFLTPTGWQAGTVTDASNDFTAAPLTLAASPTHYEVRWTPPATWAKLAPPFTLPVGAAAITTAFWRRIRTTGITVAGPMSPTRVRVRSKQYGNANTDGTITISARMFKAASLFLRGPLSGTGAIGLELVNFTNGESRSISIPSTAVQGSYISVDFADIALAAGAKWGLIYANGTRTATDVVIDLED